MIREAIHVIKQQGRQQGKSRDTGREEGSSPAEGVLKQARELLGDYEQLRRVHASLAEQSEAAVREELEADAAKVEQLLGLGKKASERAVARAVGLDDACAGQTGNDEAKAETYFRHGKQEDGRFRDVMIGLEKGVKRIAKVLPQEQR